MSTYVMSDLHGEADMFHQMLQKINLTDSDDLYILGDVIDRGPDGIALIHKIMATPNIHMLMGNHEYMMIQYLDPNATVVEILRWGNNGNEPTLLAFDLLEKQEKDEVLQYIQNLPTHVELDLNGKVFYLVHAFPGENVHDEVWVRPAIDTANPMSGKVLIIGHTPVLNLLYSKESRVEYEEQMISRGEHPKIHHAEGFIDIDCGCSYRRPLKTLGCLRLDDMQEFYVNS